MSARSFKKGVFADYLLELKAKREMAESISSVAKSGLSLTDAAASVLSEKILDQAMRLDANGEGALDDSNSLSLSLSRLRLGDQRAKFLEAKLREIEQKLELQQFDAATAVLDHAKEIREVTADSKLDAAAKTERVRKILFGQKPDDFKPITTKGAQPE